MAVISNLDHVAKSTYSAFTPKSNIAQIKAIIFNRECGCVLQPNLENQKF